MFFCSNQNQTNGMRQPNSRVLTTAHRPRHRKSEAISPPQKHLETDLP